MLCKQTVLTDSADVMSTLVLRVQLIIEGDISYFRQVLCLTGASEPVHNDIFQQQFPVMLKPCITIKLLSKLYNYFLFIYLFFYL